MKEKTMTDKNCLSLLKKETVYKRKLTGKREIRSAVRGETAKMAIGELQPGCEIYGFTKGQFCLIDIIEHVIKQAGPSEVVICTWSAAGGDIRAAHRMLRAKDITDLKFIVDFSFKSRKPDFCQQLLETFGPDSIRVTKIHAKFCTIKSKDFNLVIRTSMNLNYNPRFENFEISDCKPMYDFMSEIVDEIWRTQAPHEGFTNRPSDNVRGFESLYPADCTNAVRFLTPASAKEL